MRKKIEAVPLGEAVKAQVEKIDSLTLQDLPEQYRNKGYLGQMAQTMMKKALEDYQHGRDMRSIDENSDRPLPSDGQAGAFFQQAKLCMHASDKYAELAGQL
ncbi:MAG TPA: hypothetical protein VHD62_15380 [Opitutaceae bacterium]|nr:hypothetical protein [Opitutaceae bacterium]